MRSLHHSVSSQGHRRGVRPSHDSRSVAAVHVAPTQNIAVVRWNQADHQGELAFLR